MAAIGKRAERSYVAPMRPRVWAARRRNGIDCSRVGVDLVARQRPRLLAFLTAGLPVDAPACAIAEVLEREMRVPAVRVRVFAEAAGVPAAGIGIKTKTVAELRAPRGVEIALAKLPPAGVQLHRRSVLARGEHLKHAASAVSP